MALTDIPSFAPSRRLDSWKEIAEYIGRDVRTATRWESQGMSVHRIPGGKGRSVFALSNEIDNWMAGRQSETAADVPAPAAEVQPTRCGTVSPIATPALFLFTLSLGAMAVVMRGSATANSVGDLRVTATATEISLAGASGKPRVIYRFQHEQAMLIDRTPARVIDMNGDGDADIVTGISFFTDGTAQAVRGGELLNLATGGDMHWRVRFDDALAFRDETFNGPWVVAAWDASKGTPPSRIAVSVHDYIWWASVVSTVDADGRRRGSFVNPGWIESLMWLSPNRLAAAGFSSLRNEAVIALIDADSPDGQAPGSIGTPFWCANCSAHAPLFYATMARSEVNLVTASPFNRANVALVGDRVMVTTSEVGSSPATAIYEFDRDLTFLRAQYSEAYWELHDQLQHEGRLSHSRANCPQRDGPPPIHVWDAAVSQWKIPAR